MRFEWPNAGILGGSDRLGAYGRNGGSHCTGLEVLDLSQYGYLSLRPVNTKGLATSGVRIDMPADPDTLDQIAKSLRDLAGDIRRTRCDRDASLALEMCHA